MQHTVEAPACVEQRIFELLRSHRANFYGTGNTALADAMLLHICKNMALLIRYTEAEYGKSVTSNDLFTGSRDDNDNGATSGSLFVCGVKNGDKTIFQVLQFTVNAGENFIDKLTVEVNEKMRNTLPEV